MARKPRTVQTNSNASNKPAEPPKATQQARRKRNPTAVRIYRPRDPAKRIKDPERVQKLFKAFIDGASPARIDYARIGAEESAVAGMLAQLTILAFGQDGQGGFRKTSASRLKRSKAAAALRVGMIVRYKRASEQAEVEEDAGKGNIKVLKVGAKTVRVVCNGFEFTPLASQLEIDWDWVQPGEFDGDDVECGCTQTPSGTHTSIRDGESSVEADERYAQELAEDEDEES